MCAQSIEANIVLRPLNSRLSKASKERIGTAADSGVLPVQLHSQDLGSLVLHRPFEGR